MESIPACVRLPKKAYRYWPIGVDAALAPGKHGRRLIFHRQELTEREEAQLLVLQTALDSNLRICKSLPEDWTRHDALRFLYSARWDVQTAAAAILADALWRKSTLRQLYPANPPLEVLVSPSQSSGGVYLHGRDHKYRPLIVIVPSILRQFLPTQAIEAIAFLLEFVIAHMLLPGQVENWVLVIDLDGASSVSRIVETKQDVKAIVSFFALHYPCRLFNAFVLNADPLLWSAVAALADLESSRLFLETSASCDRLLEQVHESQLEHKYGGTAPDLQSFWPPNWPQGRYRLAGEKTRWGEYSSFPEYFPERSLTEESSFETAERKSNHETLFLSDLLSQEISSSGRELEEEEITEIISANAPIPTTPANYPEITAFPPPLIQGFPDAAVEVGCCSSSCTLL